MFEWYIFIADKTSAMNTYIYILENIDNDPNKVYIGKSIDPNRRRNAHYCRFTKTINFKIIDTINSQDREIWKPIETYWIQYYKDKGFNVINQNEGGGGFNKANDLTRVKMSKAKQGFNVTWGNKISESKKGIKRGSFNKEHIKNLTQSRIKNQGTPVKQTDSEGNTIKEFDSISLAAQYLFETFNIPTKLINIKNGIKDCASGKQNTAYGFKWQYKSLDTYL